MGGVKRNRRKPKTSCYEIRSKRQESLLNFFKNHFLYWKTCQSFLQHKENQLTGAAVLLIWLLSCVCLFVSLHSQQFIVEVLILKIWDPSCRDDPVKRGTPNERQADIDTHGKEYLIINIKNIKMTIIKIIKNICIGELPCSYD